MNKLTCNFQGRLGNLMFEVAAVVATAKRQGMTPCFPANECDYYHGIPAFQQYLKPILRQFESWNNAAAFRVHEDNIHGYSELPVFTQDTMLRGFYTCSRYFNDYRQDIINLFSRDKETVATRVRDMRTAHAGRKIVAVHIRRTDYVTDYGWALPLDYYKKAAERFPGAVFAIFSDDHAWCRSELGFLPDRAYLDDKDYICIQLLGQFDGCILANSTFSTWGAILGDPDMKKEIVSPKIWIPEGRGNHNKDIHEPHWMQI